MSKVMFLIFGFLFSTVAFSATVSINGTTGSTVSTTNNATGPGSVPKYASYSYDVSSVDGAYTYFDVVFQDNSYTPLNVQDAGFELLSGGSTVYSGDFAGLSQGFDFVYQLVADVQYTLTVFATILQTPTRIALSASAVPVPAALWLFVPALLGLFGLRRKSIIANSIKA